MEAAEPGGFADDVAVHGFQQVFAGGSGGQVEGLAVPGMLVYLN